MLLTTLIELISITKNRVEPKCIYFKDCGGCSIQHISYNTQINLKIKHVKDIFSRLFKIKVDYKYFSEDIQNSLYYRNRAIIPMRTVNNTLKVGYYKRHSHEIVNINDCPVLDPRINSLIIPIKQDINISKIHADSDLSSNTALRHICFRIGHYTGEILITLVGSYSYTDKLKTLATKWLTLNPNIKGVTLNIQKNKNNVIFGSETMTLVGSNYIHEQFCGLKFRITSTTFFQVNTIQAERVVKLICSWFKRDYEVSKIIDSYCGVGAISLPLAKLFDVIGIEINYDSILQAKMNAKINHINSIKFLHGDVSSLMNHILTKEHGIVLDPPRKGVSNIFLNIIREKRPIKIAYLSCNPSTLSRDIKVLISNNLYKLESIHPIDFFPQTSHIECLALLRIN